MNKKRLIFLIIITICFFITNKSTKACDMSAFEQTEFSERCQKLIDLCQKAYITMISDHPDKEKRLSEVSKDWIDFYLSHGKKDVQPPNMSFIPADIWERKLKELGNKFNSFLHNNIDSKTFLSIILELNLFKNEANLTQLHGSFKAAELCERDISKIENLDIWLDTRLRIPSSIIWQYEEELTDLVIDLNLTVEDHIESIERFKKVLKDESKNQETKQSLFNAINKAIDQSLEQWEKTFYYK